MVKIGKMFLYILQLVENFDLICLMLENKKNLYPGNRLLVFFFDAEAVDDVSKDSKYVEIVGEKKIS